MVDLQCDYECAGEILGPEIGEVRELSCLGRSIRLTDAGLEWEGDPKHAEAFLKKLQLGECKAAKTPGVKKDEEEDAE